MIQTYLDVGRDGEAISPAGLAKEAWPSSAPESENVPSRNDAALLAQLEEECLCKADLNLKKILSDVGEMNTVDAVMHILNHRAFQFNSRVAFAEFKPWRDAVKNACDSAIPIEIVIPIFCVIGNPVKRFNPATCTLGEIVTLRNLLDIHHVVSKIYPPGVQFKIIVDSTFYAMPFGISEVQAVAYFQALQREVVRMKAEKVLCLYDMSCLLSEVGELFYNSYNKWRKIFHDNETYGISRSEYNSWLNSMLASFNIAKYDLPYEDMRNLYTKNTLSDFHIIARDALTEYRAVKAAAADLQWEQRFFPGSIRATIHTKKVPVLGLRLYPEYKRRSRFLPYHGIAVVKKCPKRKHHVMTIQPELFVVATPNMTRLKNAAGVTMAYLDERLYE